MARKSLKNIENPATSKVADAMLEEEEVKPQRTDVAPGWRVVPEVKSKKLQVLMQPSLHTALKEKADRRGISVNEAISEAVRAYTHQNTANS